MPIPAKSSLALVPASARSSAPARQVESKELPDAAAAALTVFEKILGGRAAFIDALSATPTASPEVDLVLHLLADPANDRTRLSTLCYRSGLTPGTFFVALQSAKLAKAHLHSLSLVAEKLPEVMQAMIVEALPHEVLCLPCDGLGTRVPLPTPKRPNPEPSPCVRCRGTGRVVMPGDLESQKLLLELVAFIKRDKGTQIINQQNTQVNTHGGSGPSIASGGGSLEQLQQAVSEILFGRDQPLPAAPSSPVVVPGDTDPIEGEVVV